MAHKGYTGFDFFAAGDAPICGFTQPFTQAVGPGRFSVGAGNWNPYRQGIDNRWALDSPSNGTPFFGFGWMYSVDTVEQSVFCVADGGTGQFTLTWNGADQKFRVRQGSGLSGTVLGTSAAIVGMTANSWHHVELIVTIADAGSVEVKLDGVSALTATGDTKQSSTAQVTHVVWPASLNVGGNVLMSYDDMYAIDTSGAAPNVSIGDCRVRLLRDTADGSHGDFLPSTSGTHFDKVNSMAGTTYVSSSIVGDKDTYDFQQVPPTSVVLGVKVNLGMVKTDAGARSIAPLIVVGGTDHEGTPIPLAASLRVYGQIFGANPATSAAWTASQVNSAEFGVQTAV